MSLSDDFKAFRKRTSSLSRTFRGMAKELRAIRAEGKPPRANRWNTIGRTRKRAAAILTTYVQSITGIDGKPRYPGRVVKPEDISQMRLVGRVRAWEDAHCWEAWASTDDERIGPHLYSFSTLTEIVKAGKVLPVGDDGEVSA